MNESARATSKPLLVEAFLLGATVSGLTCQVDERRRLVDVLNTPAPTLLLESASVLTGDGAEPRQFASLYIEKRALLAAVPYETLEQIRLRATLRIGLNRASPRARLTVIVPPLTIEGFIQIQLGKGPLHTDPELFPRFFALANATLHQPGGASREVPVVIVNRDAVVALSRIDQAPALGLAS